ncbi:uncharacterized protein LAESUDRAFT_758824 [Laetiporus sulphureus 93-53]|uniref:Uncharacterized protein n=1 Tax=Laetiporus sulphureus 93-53 TaxID=1314785 RepID=A0A165EGD5_9APHY|nr:uncharacterized protein LAESUDRAFT_758824 [Laetiporus sulphureus 93-53]KZT07001.1 hypothetical protein LAESUDRAFT_758824 [Laetiporus sulphureus 93-53]
MVRNIRAMWILLVNIGMVRVQQVGNACLRLQRPPRFCRWNDVAGEGIVDEKCNWCSSLVRVVGAQPSSLATSKKKRAGQDSGASKGFGCLDSDVVQLLWAAWAAAAAIAAFRTLRIWEGKRVQKMPMDLDTMIRLPGREPKENKSQGCDA